MEQQTHTGNSASAFNVKPTEITYIFFTWLFLQIKISPGKLQNPLSIQLSRTTGLLVWQTKEGYLSEIAFLTGAVLEVCFLFFENLLGQLYVAAIYLQHVQAARQLPFAEIQLNQLRAFR